MPPADHEGRGPQPNGGTETTRGDARFTPASTGAKDVTAERPSSAARKGICRGKKEAGRRGSSEDDLPLRLNHAPDRWRRTGSESVAGRAWTRRGEYLQSGGWRSSQFASGNASAGGGPGVR